MPLDLENIGRFIMALSVVLLLLLGLKWLLSKGWGKAYFHAHPSLEVKASLSLDSRRRLLVVSYEKIPYFLLLGPHNDCLSPVSLPSSPPPPDSLKKESPPL